MCVVPAETPAGPLAPFERRVVAHVALRAGVRGEVPAPALSDGFEGGETDFMKAFREEVDADARQRGLTRSRLSGRRIGLLCSLLLIPAGALHIAVAAAHRHDALAYAGLSYLAGCWVTGGVGISRRRSAAGQDGAGPVAFGRRGAPGGTASLAASGGGRRLLAYAAALGAAPAAVAVFAQGGTNVAWSSYRGSWQQIEIETNTWPWPRSRHLAGDRRRPDPVRLGGDLAGHARHGGAGRGDSSAWPWRPSSRASWGLARRRRCSRGSPSSTAR